MVLIPTQTIVNSAQPDVNIFTFYSEAGLPNTIQAILEDSVGFSNGTAYIEGELIIAMINYPTDIDYTINNNGELVVFTPNVGDADQYEIDLNGELTYTQP